MGVIKRAISEVLQSGPLSLLAGSTEFAGGFIGDLFRLIKDEREYNVSRLMSRRTWLWRREFLTHADEVFQLDKNDPEEYMSQYFHRRIASRVNRFASDVLDNKIVFQKLMQNEHADLLPDLYGYIYDVTVHTPTGEELPVEQWIED